jgi:hypothetical protein
MYSRFVATKLFLGLAILCVVVGAVLPRASIGNGLTWRDVFNPMWLVVIPALIPFAAAIPSAMFALVYFGVEKKCKRPVNFPLLLLHLTSYLLLILGHETLVRFWWGAALDAGHATSTHFPFWAGELLAVSLATCCLAFGLNIFLSMSKTPLVADNVR